MTSMSLRLLGEDMLQAGLERGGGGGQPRHEAAAGAEAGGTRGGGSARV